MSGLTTDLKKLPITRIECHSFVSRSFDFQGVQSELFNVNVFSVNFCFETLKIGKRHQRYLFFSCHSFELRSVVQNDLKCID